MYRSYAGSQADFRPFADVQTQLRNLTQDFATSFNTGNYDQAASLFATDGALMAPQDEGAYGQKSVERLLRQMGESGYSDLRLETTRVDHSGDMAMELGRFSVVVRKADGAKTLERGKYVKVWRRLGAWLILADCWSRTSAMANDKAA
ncbi:MAG TPA: nuclear transport factor 2 family protein [Candidatus Acidoferrales bacterium]|jgi:ketosteroid isomerase-like protein|nr:nuclear transport factor 2 family protein [Candidatus Acidoferrales bacterium]